MCSGRGSFHRKIQVKSNRDAAVYIAHVVAVPGAGVRGAGEWCAARSQVSAGTRLRSTLHGFSVALSTDYHAFI
jgi:hypothetical protein